MSCEPTNNLRDQFTNRYSLKTAQPSSISNTNRDFDGLYCHYKVSTWGGVELQLVTGLDCCPIMAEEYSLMRFILVTISDLFHCLIAETTNYQNKNRFDGNSTKFNSIKHIIPAVFCDFSFKIGSDSSTLWETRFLYPFKKVMLSFYGIRSQSLNDKIAHLVENIRIYHPHIHQLSSVCLRSGRRDRRMDQPLNK